MMAGTGYTGIDGMDVIDAVKRGYLRGFEHGYLTAKLGKDWWRPDSGISNNVIKSLIKEADGLAKQKDEDMDRFLKRAE